jgi:hypothetical protein
MNERIQELAEQATTEEADGFKYFDKAKFAELIVNQCADIAQQHNKSPVAAPLAIGYVIREHFGVTELNYVDRFALR